MARYAIIEGNSVVNVIEAEAGFAASVGAIQSDSASPGDIYEGGVFSKPDLSLPSAVAEYDAALTQHLDSVAKQRNYADRISCAVRAGYPSQFQAEGIAFGTWMDACNVIGYTMLAEFQQGLIPQPTIAEMIAALPEMVWP